MRGLLSHPALEVVQHLPRRRGSGIGQCAILRGCDDLARTGENHEGRNAALDGTAVSLGDVQIPVPISHVDVHHVEIVIQEGTHRLVLVQMRQNDAVEAPVGAEVEEHELAVGLSLAQCRLNVLVGVSVLVIRALRARGGVRTDGECQEGAQREGLHTSLHGPTCGTAATGRGLRLQGFSISASTSLAASASRMSTRIFTGPVATLKPPGKRPSPIKSWRPSPCVTNGMPWDSSAAFASARATGFAVWKTVTISGCLMCRDTFRETAGESRPCPWYLVRPPPPRGYARWPGTRHRTRNRPAPRRSCPTPPDSRDRARRECS